MAWRWKHAAAFAPIPVPLHHTCAISLPFKNCPVPHQKGVSEHLLFLALHRLPCASPLSKAISCSLALLHVTDNIHWVGNKRALWVKTHIRDPANQDRQLMMTASLGVLLQWMPNTHSPAATSTSHITQSVTRPPQSWARFPRKRKRLGEAASLSGSWAACWTSEAWAYTSEVTGICLNPVDAAFNCCGAWQLGQTGNGRVNVPLQRGAAREGWRREEQRAKHRTLRGFLCQLELLTGTQQESEPWARGMRKQGSSCTCNCGWRRSKQGFSGGDTLPAAPPCVTGTMKNLLKQCKALVKLGS